MRIELAPCVSRFLEEVDVLQMCDIIYFLVSLTSYHGALTAYDLRQRFLFMLSLKCMYLLLFVTKDNHYGSLGSEM